MNVISNQIDLTSEDALKVFNENGFENADITISYIRKKFSGYGHYNLSVDIEKNDGNYDTITLSRTTTNMRVVDEWNEDESYFEGDSWFDSQNHLMKHVLDYIVELDYNKDILNAWLNN